MKVKITIILVYLIVLSELSANEPLLARLEAVISNETQRFGIANNTFICKPYGVLTLEWLYSNSPQDSECRKSIEQVYTKNPQLLYFTRTLLKNKQLYHIEFKNKSCIIYAKGEISLSELLLRKGLALYQPRFKDEEFLSYFTKAQESARIEKKGLWKENIFKNCTKELNKD